MQIRKATMKDLPAMMDIYENARLFMKQTGNPNQWVHGYPPEEMLIADIKKGCSYVCCDALTGEILATFYFAIEEDESYKNIYEGNWLNQKPYGVIHRIAATGAKKGVGSFCLAWCLQNCSNVRIDTHHDNKVMQNLLTRNGYTLCGVIYLPDGAPRIAYQKTA